MYQSSGSLFNLQLEDSLAKVLSKMSDFELDSQEI